MDASKEEKNTNRLKKFGVFAAISLVSFYQILIRPHLAGSCRFEPSCSHYAQAVFREYGFIQGFKLTGQRLAECHPWGKFVK